MIELLGTYTEDNASQARDDAHKYVNLINLKKKLFTHIVFLYISDYLIFCCYPNRKISHCSKVTVKEHIPSSFL